MHKAVSQRETICCLCLGTHDGGGVHPLLRMIYKLYWMSICDTCEHVLNVKQHYFPSRFSRKWR